MAAARRRTKVRRHCRQVTVYMTYHVMPLLPCGLIFHTGVVVGHHEFAFGQSGVRVVGSGCDPAFQDGWSHSVMIGVARGETANAAISAAVRLWRTEWNPFCVIAFMGRGGPCMTVLTGQLANLSSNRTARISPYGWSGREGEAPGRLRCAAGGKEGDRALIRGLGLGKLVVAFLLSASDLPPQKSRGRCTSVYSLGLEYMQRWQMHRVAHMLLHVEQSPREKTIKNHVERPRATFHQGLEQHSV
ncbi:unnamed protein product [Symbiodinium sp. CCMP2456]|nr:unnamed protein product [Symbiodinium sp. CCMP2456]